MVNLNSIETVTKVCPIGTHAMFTKCKSLQYLPLDVSQYIRAKLFFVSKGNVEIHRIASFAVRSSAIYDVIKER